MSHTKYDSPEFEEEVESHALTLRGFRLTAALAFVTGTGFTLFGYVLLIMMVSNKINCSFQFQIWSRCHGITPYSKTGTGGSISVLVWAAYHENKFEKTFPEVIVTNEHKDHATLQSLLVAIYVRVFIRILALNRYSMLFLQEIGCLIGALSNLWVGDRLGRRRWS